MGFRDLGDGEKRLSRRAGSQGLHRNNEGRDSTRQTEAEADCLSTAQGRKYSLVNNHREAGEETESTGHDGRYRFLCVLPPLDERREKDGEKSGME